MAAFSADAPHPPLPAQDLADQSEAARWAAACEWVPGSGRCLSRDCDAACIFAPQRQAEAVRLLRSRRLRRKSACRR